MIVKIPATHAGIAAIEESTYRGHQHQRDGLLHAPAVHRGRGSGGAWIATTRGGGQGRRDHGAGLHHHGRPPRRLAEGRAERDGLAVDPGYLEWAGVAVFKKAYGIFRERGYRLRLLSAAFRNHMHWSELIGADVVISPPYAWQERFNASDIEVKARIDNPVDPKVVERAAVEVSRLRSAPTPRTD